MIPFMLFLFEIVVAIVVVDIVKPDYSNAHVFGVIKINLILFELWT